MLTLVKTNDGSLTFFNAEVGEHYHSKHGALQESRHVFLNSGLLYFLSQNPEPVGNIHILEAGFGTGLNFLLSADFCSANKINLDYTGIEAYPLSDNMIKQTGYNTYISEDLWNTFTEKYPYSLKQEVPLNGNCQLQIAHCKLLEFSSTKQFNIVYFDAFAAVHQPEMWEYESINHICSFLKPGGVFVTYAITGNLKRIMKSIGFAIEKAPGAPGKREMLRAVKY
ncbi:MAG TPA: tRNA (5-methylaminomethyl-2-thiouridine)(34)-methyltransferase MnmD [Sphingobacteriaceae bacterium]